MFPKQNQPQEPFHPRPITDEQFKDSVRSLLLKKLADSEISEDYEPTPEELDEIYRMESVPKSEQGK